MTLNYKKIVSLALLALLILVLPFVIFLSRQKQDIRPKALQGKANILLSSSQSSPKKGENFDVLISIQLTDSSLRISGADLTLLYDKTRLSAENVTPYLTALDPGAAFNEAVHVSKGGNYDNAFNFARIAVVSTKSDGELKGGTVQVARITFKALSDGEAVIRFPDDNSLLEIVGTNISGSGPTLVPPTSGSSQNQTASAVLSLVPESGSISLNQTVNYELKAAFSGGSAAEKIDYFRAVISFPKDYLQMPADGKITLTSEGQIRGLRIDTSGAANASGQIIIEFGARNKDEGFSTDHGLTVATIPLTAVKTVSAGQNLVISRSGTQMVNSNSKALVLTVSGTSFTVVP